MKVLKTIILYTLFLFSMILCGTAVMKILDLIFHPGYENVWTIGYKVGFVAWLFLSVISIVNKTKKKNSTKQSGKQSAQR